jgi:hypothetical protein
MFIATAVVSGLLALALLASSRGKLVKDPQVMKVVTTVGVPENRRWVLAAAETAGAGGIVTGLFWWPAGVAGTTGVVLPFVGAIAAHLRVKDNGVVPALALLVMAVAVLVLRASTT